MDLSFAGHCRTKNAPCRPALGRRRARSVAGRIPGFCGLSVRIRGMGVWDTAIFSNDIACDIRDHYRELIEDGFDDMEATRQTIEKFQK
jgi:hypothetical protein